MLLKLFSIGANSLIKQQINYFLLTNPVFSPIEFNPLAFG
ncbi:hypothetical protein YPPY66_2198 [Yersinia pestis PY-66]|uniref:Uncharacterized protein n=3 Tax=Yersinia pseudotuberculosis complex TaxID=1649845 RepID=A0A0U1QYA4_YERP3|nr:hypothetical protein YpsIP31758_1655 [Yersinia pseudotuberculosis IP 31758]ABX86186.1 hypothetical protein YpAngola_A3529 [Yersinia pestis Angola]ADV98406.1 hypothetical protein YPC_1798 [Yersinia pestis biovar Medievalis str. Harbin 35]EDR32227.1 hypothetical protein YPIP275_0526 [Yersinia pestis biovar Orientalis str. IP275]EDR39766.1 hypothetical protein YpF1991016_1632 [Yersinia pestis biovar Orientalis str. F1991016]EDR45181.1 hypothetical protein YpE1979001_1894 [Yersinia pestis biova